MKAKAALIILGALLVWIEPIFADETLDQKKAEWTSEMRARQVPMIEELEGMLGNDTKMTLLAVDPMDNSFRVGTDGTWLGKKTLRGHIVRSSAAIDDVNERSVLVRALTDGMRDTDGSAAACFEPYFGITIEKGNKKIDVLVCFSCLHAQVYGAYAGNSFLTSDKHLDVFLTAAKKHGLSLPYVHT